jgi:hypothetical protein
MIFNQRVRPVSQLQFLVRLIADTIYHFVQLVLDAIILFHPIRPSAAELVSIRKVPFSELETLKYLIRGFQMSTN